MAEASTSINSNTRSLIVEAMEKASAVSKRRSKKVKSSAKASSNDDARTERTLDADVNVAQASASNADISSVSSTRKFRAEDLEEFIIKIFFELDLKEIDSMLLKKVNRRSKWPKIVLAFRKRMFSLFFGLQPLHQRSFEEFFDRIPLIRQHVFYLMACHCKQIIDRCPNVFLGLIYVCSFMYELSLFLKKHSLPEFEQKLGCDCTIVFCEYFIQEKLEAHGGLDELQNYMSEDNVIDIIEYVTMMYCDPHERTTTIFIRHYEFEFSVTKNKCYEDLILRLPLMKIFMQRLFPGVMAPNTFSNQQILSAFSTLRQEVIIRNNLDARRADMLTRSREEELMALDVLQDKIKQTLKNRHKQSPSPFL